MIVTENTTSYIKTMSDTTSCFTITYANDTQLMGYCPTTGILIYISIADTPTEGPEGQQGQHVITNLYGRPVQNLAEAMQYTYQTVVESAGDSEEKLGHWSFRGYIVRDFESTTDEGYEHHLYVCSCSETEDDYCELFTNTIDLLNEEDLCVVGTYHYPTDFTKMYFSDIDSLL